MHFIFDRPLVLANEFRVHPSCDITIQAPFLAHHLEYDPDIWENVSDWVLHRLKRFTFYYVNGDALQMAFLKFVLAKSPVLQTMSITIANRAMEEKSSILESLISYRRASCLLKEVEVDKELFSLALLNLESNDS